MNHSLYLGFKLTAALVIFSASAFSQGFINNGAYVVNNGAYLVITGATGHFTNGDAGAITGWVNNSGTIQVAGDWINNSTQNLFTANSGTVELNGAAQSLGGTTTTWFNNLSLLGSGNKTMNIDQVVGGGYAAPAGILSLNDRPLLLNTYQLTVTNPFNTAITRTSGYIVSEMNSGTNTAIVQWNVGANNAAYVFPFGTTTAPNYIPLTISKTAGIANILASTRMTSTNDNSPWETSVTQMWSQTIPGPGEVPVVVDRWWDINATAGFTGAVDFTYRGAENTTTYAPTGTFAAQNWMGTSWNVPVGAGPGVLAGTAVVSIPAQALGSTTPWVLSALNSPLPIELLFFAAKPKDKVVHLEWSTASEINNAFFEVQRSKNGEHFETINIVAGSGNTTTVSEYRDIDEKPYSGISYYRLRQVDFDGQFSFSQTVTVQIANSGIFEFIFASASSARDHLLIGYQSVSTDPLTVEITDVLGHKVAGREVHPSEGYNQENISLPELSSGIYMITLVNSSVLVSKKVFMN